MVPETIASATKPCPLPSVRKFHVPSEFFAVGDAEVATADLDAHGRIASSAYRREQALAGLDIGIAAGLVHHLVKAIDKPIEVGTAERGGAVPAAGTASQSVDSLLNVFRSA